MRITIVLFLTFFATAAIAQTQEKKFNNQFVLKDGIYTSYEELLMNAPLYPSCVLQVAKNGFNEPNLKYYIAGNENNLLKFTSPVFATVLKGKLMIYYKNELFTTYSKGTLCTFIYKYIRTSPGVYNAETKTRSSSTSEFKYQVCLLDIKTGTITKLNKKNLGSSIMRDPTLYQSYLKVKPGKNNKNLIKYISDFNDRNPTLMPTPEEAVIIKEE